MPDVRRKYLETIVAGMTNRVEVEDPADHPDLAPGDLVPYWMVRDNNRRAGTENVQYKPVLRGVNILPVVKSQENWLAGMNYRRLKDVLREGTMRGSRADIHDWNPIPAYAHGAAFGLGEGGRY